MGDLSAKFGNEEIEQVTGRFGLGEMNERGERWASWCKANSQTIMNTRFKHHERFSGHGKIQETNLKAKF